MGPMWECTLPETNSKFAPDNGWLEYDPASFWGVKRPIFRGEVLLVSGRVPPGTPHFLRVFSIG